MNHKQVEEEIRELIRKEHPDISSYKTCSFDELILEFPQYRKQIMMGDVKILLISCPECNIKMPEDMKENHKRFCKVNRVISQESLDINLKKE